MVEEARQPRFTARFFPHPCLLYPWHIEIESKASQLVEANRENPSGGSDEWTMNETLKNFQIFDLTPMARLSMTTVHRQSKV